MKIACEKWKEPLREASLTGTRSRELAEHLQACAQCAAELRELETHRARLDALLPEVTRSAEPSPDFRARVLAAAEAASTRRHVPRWQYWTLAGTAATAAIVLVVSAVWHREASGKIPPEELAAAQKLAEWRAPSDSLLQTPGREILRTTPRLGESYLHVPMKEVEEE
jgi:anti-sigma factor RsiW